MKRTKEVGVFKLMMNKIRKTKEYINWRSNVLKQAYPHGAPKGTQVHHTTNFSQLLRDNNIEDVDGAIKCSALWKAEGICLSRGEHFLLTRLALYKYPSSGFVLLLSQELERLSFSIYNKRPEKKKNVKANR